MHITIKRIGGTKILSGDYPDIKEAVEHCARKGVSLINADLAGANLAGVDLRGVDFSCANLSGANLRGANLSGADLSCADLRGANLAAADLLGANLRGAILFSAKLFGADLVCADLSGANFQGAALGGVNFSYAILEGANFESAKLFGANLSGANLRGAKLAGASLPYFQLCPEERAFVGYKKLRNGLIATLEIPTDVPRTSSLVGRDCRAQSARVLSIETPDGTKVPEGVSIHDKNFLYRTGEIVFVPDYDPDIRVECTQGVHFFMTKEEARKYVF
jgi:hypothetical protein